jgi:hypothetical protein
MKSQALPRFWKLYGGLPKEVRRRVGQTFRIWKQHPEAPGLHFKRVSETRPVYSVRIGDDFRALGLLHGDTVT